MLFALAVIGCGADEPLDRFDAPDAFARPIQLTGSSRFDLWALIDPAASQSASTTIAHSSDGGMTWTSTDVHQLTSSAPVQLDADGEGRVWVVGTSPDDRPALVLVMRSPTETSIEDFTSTFPVGTREVTLRVEGHDPDPMITARLPFSTERSLYLLDDKPAQRSWIRFPMPSGLDLELVAVATKRGGYFFLNGTFHNCSFLIDQVGETHGCSESLWPANHDEVYLSRATLSDRWLWWPDATGGHLMHATSSGIEAGAIEDWPNDHRPVRFVSFESGYRGVVAIRSSAFVFVTLDRFAHVSGAVHLADCGSACDVPPRSVTRLSDESLLIVGADRWFLGTATLP